MPEPALPDRDAPPRMTDRASIRRSYVVPIPERFNLEVDIVESWAAEEPRALALVSLDGNGDECSGRHAYRRHAE